MSKWWWINFLHWCIGDIQFAKLCLPITLGMRNIWPRDKNKHVVILKSCFGRLLEPQQVPMEHGILFLFKMGKGMFGLVTLQSMWDGTWLHNMWHTIPIARDNILCHFCSYNIIVQTESHFVLKCPLHNFSRERIASLFLNM